MAQRSVARLRTGERKKKKRESEPPRSAALCRVMIALASATMH